LIRTKHEHIILETFADGWLQNANVSIDERTRRARVELHAAGLSLAGVPLLQKTRAGFAPRPAPEIACLIQAAYGAGGDPTRLESSLGVVARALNGGDVARAGIAAVLTRTPELSREGAARLAKADGALAKYDPDEPRDWPAAGRRARPPVRRAERR
jgi:hypothetical protein